MDVEEQEMREIRERRAEIRREMAENRDKIAVILARHSKRIYTENQYPGVEYNSQHVVRRADLQITLSEDEEYQGLQKRKRDLDYEDDILIARLPEDEL